MPTPGEEKENGHPTQGCQPVKLRAQHDDWHEFFLFDVSTTSPPSRALFVQVLFFFVVRVFGYVDALEAVMTVMRKDPLSRAQTRPAIEFVSGEEGLRPLLVVRLRASVFLPRRTFVCARRRS